LYIFEYLLTSYGSSHEKKSKKCAKDILKGVFIDPFCRVVYPELFVSGIIASDPDPDLTFLTKKYELFLQTFLQNGSLRL
jgi:hypothetical protein